MTATKVPGKHVAVLTVGGLEGIALERPRATLVSVSLDSESVPAGPRIDAHDQGHRIVRTFTVDRPIREIPIEEFDALIIPGGATSIDRLRTDQIAVAFVRDFVDSGRVVGVLRHGPGLLVEAGVVAGRSLSCARSVRAELIRTGARILDQDVAIDANLISSRSPASMSAFCANIVSRLARQSEHADAGTPGRSHDIDVEVSIGP